MVEKAEGAQPRKFEFLPLSLHIETLGGIATPLVLRGTPLPGIAQHFSAGNRIALENESAKRTTEFILARASASAVRLTDWGFVFGRDPTDKSVRYYQSSALRTFNSTVAHFRRQSLGNPVATAPGTDLLHLPAPSGSVTTPFVLPFFLNSKL